MKKLWSKNTEAQHPWKEKVAHFTIGKDNETDMIFAAYDVLGTLAHVEMLVSQGLMLEQEWHKIKPALIRIYNDILLGNFSISEGVEDIHSEVEFRLTEQLGDVGKKVHSGRSRNDQVILDLKLVTRAKIEALVSNIQGLFELLLEKSETFKHILLPGYTHLQIGMISSAGLWLSAYAESLTDDLEMLLAAFKIVNKNPLGSGAGYGGSLPLDRDKTTDLLGFEALNINAVYAQMTRGKMEKATASALAAVASTLSKFAMDITLYLSQNFDFISFPNELTTGSSIMPHKKNPDVFELIRAKSNKIQNLPNQLTLITNNLPSGYHRDMQEMKAVFLEALEETSQCVEMMTFMLEHISLRENILEDKKYLPLFSVEKVNQLVQEGVPFRDAYIQVGLAVEQGLFEMPKLLPHAHIGSKDNLQLERIKIGFHTVVKQFPFDKIQKSLKKLVSE
ncbi:MAG: argininosuccinate lyase [Chitinophagales bacterium]|nr:argininosuccinate lyase [Chitinophagales bacterium]